MKKIVNLRNVAIIIACLAASSAFAQGGTTGPLTWELNGNTLTISGNGAMPNYALGYNPSPWDKHRELIYTVVIETGVTTIGAEAFKSCGSLTSITIPSSVTTIGNSTFASCYSLPSVTIPSSVTSIGDGAFSECCDLLSITVPNSVTTIGNSAFAACYSLTSITLSNNITSIEGWTFSACMSLISVTIPNSVRTIEIGAFAHCYSLTSVTIPNGVTTIEEQTFSNCYGLALITIPSSVTTIGRRAFEHCTSLTSITIPNSVISIGTETFSNCTSLTSITIPNSVTDIGYRTFEYCTSLISATISNGVTTLNGIFDYCENLTVFIIPNGVTTIGYATFRGCESLTSITIHNSVTTIENEAFSRCKSLTSITNFNLVPVEISTYVFYGVTQSECALKVPKSAISDYEVAEVWKKFNIIGCDYSVHVSSNNNEYGYATGDELYLVNETAIVTATAYENCKFVNWTKNGAVVSTDNQYNFTVTEDVELVANFEKTDFIVRVSVNNEEYGIATGGGTYEANETAIVTATANNGYKFVNWTKNGTVVSTNKEYSFPVIEDIELVANFEKGDVGIEETDNYPSLRVYPNPVNYELKITNYENGAIEIYNIMGQHVMSSASLPFPETTIDVSHLPSGIYFLKIGEKTAKFVKE